MTQDEPMETRTNVLRRLAARAVACVPTRPDLLVLVLWFVGGVTMGRVLLAPGVGGRLADVGGGAIAAGVAAALVGAASFVLRMRLVQTSAPDDDRARLSRRELAVTFVAAVVVEGLLFLSIGLLAFVMWAIAMAGTLIGWGIAWRARGEAERPATNALSQLLAAGLGFGVLLAVGLEIGETHAGAGDLLTSPVALGAMAAAGSIGVGVGWGRDFERHVAAREETAWLSWIFWPAAGAMGFTYLARDAYPLWVVLALTAASLATIMGHALFATQRPRARRETSKDAHAAAFGINEVEDHVPGTPPTGVLRELVEVLPGATALVVGLLLAVAGAVA